MNSSGENLKACVIGGSGFLGSHVCDHLSVAGYAVSILDQVPSPWLRSDQQMLVGDLLDEALLDQSIAGSDVVYSFAAIADLDKALATPIDTARVKVLGNAFVLDTCWRNAVRRFIYASTVNVYSREGGFYRCSKQAAQQYVEEYQRAYGLDYTILRYGSVYGPRSDHRNGLFRIVQDALQIGVIRYVVSSEAMREYIHVEDAAMASVVILGSEFRNKSVDPDWQRTNTRLGPTQDAGRNFWKGCNCGICTGGTRRPLCAYAIRISAQARSQVYAANACGSGTGVTPADCGSSAN